MALKISSTNVVNNDRSFVLGTATPGSPVTGMIRWNSSLGEYQVYNGTAWVPINTPAPKPLWTWGNNSQGRLGDNTTISKSSPVSVVDGFRDWVQVGPGYRHSAAIRANGTVWTWGSNSPQTGPPCGQLGIGSGTISSRLSPVSVVGGFTDWVQIAGGSNHAAAIRANGTAWCWGENANGRVGDNTTSTRFSPVSVVGGFTDWVQIACGSWHTIAVRANGTAWAWGSDRQNNLAAASVGALGDNTTSSRLSPVSVVGGFTDWVQIAGGVAHTVAIRANGTAWSWGRNTSGQLGDNTTSNRSSPVSVVGGFTNWVQISASGSTAAIRANGTAWGWGINTSGQLGDNTTSNRSSPVSVVGGFTDWVQASAGSTVVAIRANGTAWAWGGNDNGGLGDNTTVLSRSSPVSVVGGFTDWVQISSGSTHIVALRAN